MKVSNDSWFTLLVPKLLLTLFGIGCYHPLSVFYVGIQVMAENVVGYGNVALLVALGVVNIGFMGFGKRHVIRPLGRHQLNKYRQALKQYKQITNKRYGEVSVQITRAILIIGELAQRPVTVAETCYGRQAIQLVFGK